MFVVCVFKPKTAYEMLISVWSSDVFSAELNDRNSCVLWGDCTSAQVISPRLPARLKVTHSQFASNPENCDKVRFVNAGHFAQEGRTVQTFAIRRTLALPAQLREELDQARAAALKFKNGRAHV